MRPTITKIVNLIEEFSEVHTQLRDFGYGDISQINTTERLMPTLWVDLTQSRVTRNSVLLGMRVYAMDLVQADDDNELDVQSDCILYLQDLIKTLRTSSRLIGEQTNFNFVPFQKKFNDRVAGWYVDIELEVDSIYGPCDVPTLNSSTLNVVSETATGVAVENLNVEGLLNVNGQYVYTRGKEQLLSTDARVQFKEIYGESYKLNRLYITSTTTIDTCNHLIAVDTTGGPFNLTLPAADEGEYTYIIKDEGFLTSSNPVTITSVDSDDRFENNKEEIIFSENGSSITIYSNGTDNYYII